MIINLNEYRSKKKQKRLEPAAENERFILDMKELAFNTLEGYLNRGKRIAKILHFCRRESDR